MRGNRAATGFPFRSLGPLWSRQIPYTMTKFYFFEKVCYIANKRFLFLDNRVCEAAKVASNVTQFVISQVRANDLVVNSKVTRAKQNQIKAVSKMFPSVSYPAQNSSKVKPKQTHLLWVNPLKNGYPL